MKKVIIENHTTIDKSFRLSTDEISMKVDYDDVNHPETDAATRQIAEIIEKHWDQKLHDQYYREELLKVWNANEYNLQGDYEGLNDYLEQHGLKPEENGK